jgi:peptidoglycan hydrolase-like protein with peptidoglycan-binding domain
MNHYDTRLADAYRRWMRRINLLPRTVPPEQLLSADEVRDVQRSLADLGYAPGKVDGIWGPQTTRALAEFQAHEGLAADSHYSPETKAALATALQTSGVGIGAPETDVATDVLPVK